MILVAAALVVIWVLVIATIVALCRAAAIGDASRIVRGGGAGALPPRPVLTCRDQRRLRRDRPAHSRWHRTAAS